MTGKIDSDGTLHIKRGNKINTLQFCPFTRSSCSHTCPHFGEPKVFSPNKINLDICMGKTLKFSALEDER